MYIGKGYKTQAHQLASPAASISPSTRHLDGWLMLPAVQSREGDEYSPPTPSRDPPTPAALPAAEPWDRGQGGAQGEEGSASGEDTYSQPLGNISVKYI